MPRAKKNSDIIATDDIKTVEMTDSELTETQKNDEMDKIKKENEYLNDKIAKLEDMIHQILEKSENNVVRPTVIDGSTYVAKMDRPCTLIHLFECYPGLETTIYVNNAPITFARFGEKRTFRFSDMQSIVSQYRDWFARGIFTLGDDCSDFADDFGVAVTKMPMSKETYSKIASLPMDEFENLIKNMNYNHRILVAKTWIQRCEAKTPGYDNVEKIKILNKYTEGFMSKMMKDLFSSDI